MGRPKGAKNLRTREREEIQAAHDRARIAREMPRQLAKERLEELADVCVGNAAKFQPSGQFPNEENYKYWLKEYKDALIALAPYQSPRLSAVAVGQVTKLNITVKGGIPPRPLTAPVKLIEEKS